MSWKKQSLDRPRGFQEFKAPRFKDNRHMKVARLSALRTGRLYPTGNIPGTHFCYTLSRRQGHSAVGRIMSMKNSSDTIGNRTRDLPAWSVLPQPTAQPRAPNELKAWKKKHEKLPPNPYDEFEPSVSRMPELEPPDGKLKPKAHIT
jgi:hypothetical protein